MNGAEISAQDLVSTFLSSAIMIFFKPYVYIKLEKLPSRCLDFDWSLLTKYVFNLSKRCKLYVLDRVGSSHFWCEKSKNLKYRLYYVIRPYDQQIPPSPSFDLKLCLNRFLTDFFSITTVQLVPSAPCPLFCVHPAFSNRWLKSEFIAAEWSFFSSYYPDRIVQKFQNNFQHRFMVHLLDQNFKLFG